MKNKIKFTGDNTLFAMFLSVINGKYSYHAEITSIEDEPGVYSWVWSSPNGNLITIGQTTGTPNHEPTEKIELLKFIKKEFTGYFLNDDLELIDVTINSLTGKLPRQRNVTPISSAIKSVLN